MHPSQTSGVARLSSRKRWWLIAALVVLTAGAGYGCWPRRANMREFDPTRVARLETAMWRDYYEKRYAALFGALYSLSRDEYGFSPWDSVRVSYFAAKAAKDFQPTRSRNDAQIALPTLEKYYGVIRARTGEDFDVRGAARLELDWWQLRREKATAAQYGAVVAATTAVVFRVKNDDILRAGLLRAEMMHFRDEHRDVRMTDGDWAQIEQGLVRSYALLKSGVAPSSTGSGQQR